jgi:hypothetical protein
LTNKNPFDRIRTMKMSLKEFTLKMINAESTIKFTVDGKTPEEIEVEFHAIDRDGVHHTFDSVDKISYDVLSPQKIEIHLS